ncbi:MAG TPA: AAA family ATPase, partial [Chloroflexota bacterium]|nr:AAA family ATPase [Chloroflexota bacterium]
MATHVPRRLIGRDRHSAQMLRHLVEAAGGQVRVVLLCGEPGIGKTSLLDTAANQAREAGAMVLRGGAVDADGMPPYLPFLEALGQYLKLVPREELRAKAGSQVAMLGTILPELTVLLPNSPANYPLPPEQARLRLFQAVGDLLGAIAASQPLVLILDDLQWADPASFDLLCFLARDQLHARILVLGAYRAGEGAQNPSLERALAELTRLRVLSTIAVDPLVDDEIADLAGVQLGAPLTVAARDTLVQQSEGNPFFAEELLRLWEDNGALTAISDSLVGRRFDLTDAQRLTLPTTIITAVRQRLCRLPDETVDLLRT